MALSVLFSFPCSSTYSYKTTKEVVKKKKENLWPSGDEAPFTFLKQFPSDSSAALADGVSTLFHRFGFQNSDNAAVLCYRCVFFFFLFAPFH
jgi:protoheme ferro-lyase